MHEHDEKPLTEEAPAAPKDFFRQHTFLNKGPNRREVREYHESRGIVLLTGKNPVHKSTADKYFAQSRAEKFPAEYVANLAVTQKQMDKARRRAVKARQAERLTDEKATSKKVSASDIEKMRASQPVE